MLNGDWPQEIHGSMSISFEIIRFHGRNGDPMIAGAIHCPIAMRGPVNYQVPSSTDTLLTYSRMSQELATNHIGNRTAFVFLGIDQAVRASPIVVIAEQVLGPVIPTGHILGSGVRSMRHCPS